MVRLHISKAFVLAASLAIPSITVAAPAGKVPPTLVDSRGKLIGFLYPDPSPLSQTAAAIVIINGEYYQLLFVGGHLNGAPLSFSGENCTGTPYFVNEYTFKQIFYSSSSPSTAPVIYVQSGAALTINIASQSNGVGSCYPFQATGARGFVAQMKTLADLGWNPPFAVGTSR
jgi:hypothetical protein